MKSLKLSFAAVIAFVAIGLTIAAQAGAFDSKSLAVDCYRPIGTQKVDIRNVCATQELIGDATVCDLTLDDDHIFTSQADLNNTTKFSKVDAALSCIGSAEFCCIRVTTDLAPCASPAQPNAIKVLDVFCED